jgi:hypothetical protein
MHHPLALLTFCQSLINDGVLLPWEVQSLNAFLGANKEYSTTFPGQHIAARLHRIYADGRITEDERADLLYLLRIVTKTEIPPDPEEADLTFDEPEVVRFGGKHFCFHGKFVCGSARWLRRATEDCGAVFQEELDSSTNCVVIGSEGSLIKSFVRRVLEQRASLRVLSEKKWLELLASQLPSIP